ncbi:MAG: tetratricopeptide repeat protein [Pseudomarimonas sp.]
MSRSWLVARLATIPLALWLASVIVRQGQADAIASKNPTRALSILPNQAEASTRELKRLFQLPPTPAVDKQIEQLATRMLRGSPLSGSAYAAFGQLQDRQGQVSQAASLMKIGAHRTPRERHTHAWLADYAVATGDFDRAAFHYDQLLRLTPRQMHTIGPALLSMAKHPEGRIALVTWMGTHAPAWRDRFLATWAAQAESQEVLDDVFDRLRRLPHSLSRQERDLWINRLLANDQVTKAHWLWVDGLPAEQRTRIGNVFDGGFELPTSGGGFGWQWGKVAGASIRAQGGTGVEGQNALVVEFRNRRVAFAHVQQRLALPPGNYSLQGRVRLDDLRNERGLKWVISCWANPAVFIAESEKLTGRKSWSDFAADFVVPAEGCRSQTLLLRLDARVPAEQWVGGRAWFDGLKIVRNVEPES